MKTEEPIIKTTKIRNKWHARLIKDDVILDEMACEYKMDVGFICREMLRWYDKLGGTSKFASKARTRQTEEPIGKVWTRTDLKEGKEKWIALKKQ